MKKEKIRVNEIIKLIAFIILTFVISVSAFTFYFTRNNEKYVTYDEKSTVDYKVYLKDNEFFSDEYIASNKGYVTSLIKSVSSNFKYYLNFSDSLSYDYSYHFTVEVDVEDTSNDSNLYHYTEELFNKELTSKTGNLYIDRDIVIDYNKYNEVINKFKSVYELKNISSTLNVYLYVSVNNIDEYNHPLLTEKKVASMSIPLTTNTISIDIGNNNINTTNNKINIEKGSNYFSVLILGIIFFIVTIILIVITVIYSIRSRTAQMIYDKEIKSIMSNFDSYIQKINGTYDIGTSQVLKIETFNDMLEIRDTLKQPILMLENKEKNGTFFIIPATNSIIYTYALRVVDIKAKMEGKEIPTYDIAEIPHEDFMKKKKYTDEYIKSQITMTNAIPTVDERNVIKGNTDSNVGLYEQLEKTRSFDINEIRKADKNKTQV